MKRIEKIKRKLKIKNQTPLHLAIMVESIETFEPLISKGADINAKDNNFQNILIIKIENYSYLINLI